MSRLKLLNVFAFPFQKEHNWAIFFIFIIVFQEVLPLLQKYIESQTVILSAILLLLPCNPEISSKHIYLLTLI